MIVPRGPHRIGQSGQITLPKDALRDAGLTAGDELYVTAYDDPPGSLLLIPMEVGVTWFEHGRKSSRSEQHADADLDR